MTTSLNRAKSVADAVLYEGHLMPPYRAAADENQARWQFGVLLPRGFAAAGSGEYPGNQTECLLTESSPGRGNAVLHVRVRFLQLRVRTAERIGPDGGYTVVPSILTGDREVSTAQEALEREVDAVLPLATLLDRERRIPFTEPKRCTIQELLDASGHPYGRVVRTRYCVTGLIRLRAHRLPGTDGGIRLRVTVENTSECASGEESRDEALRHALLSTHSLIAANGARFVSLLDPPAWAESAARDCVNVRTWPVLVGDPDRQDVLLSSPVALHDYPATAAGDAPNFLSGNGIDELLATSTAPRPRHPDDHRHTDEADR